MESENLLKVAVGALIFFSLCVFGLWLGAIWSDTNGEQLFWTGLLFIIPAFISFLVAIFAVDEV